MREWIWFSHANGFPASTYRTLFGYLEPHYEVHAIERIGHDPHYPVDRDWRGLTAELVDRLREQVAGKVWLVGHSLGGFLSLLAARQMPHRVHGVVMLDSPLIGGWRAPLLRVGQRVGVDRWVMPMIDATRRRRRHWLDRADVLQHFLAKPAFARWDRRVLDDYVEHGTYARDDGSRELAFDREIEWRIYRSLPQSPRRSPVPVGFLAGTHSRELRQAGLAATRRLVGEQLAWIDGSHLFPMEQPQVAAEAVLAMIERLRSSAAPPRR